MPCEPFCLLYLIVAEIQVPQSIRPGDRDKLHDLVVAQVENPQILPSLLHIQELHILDIVPLGLQGNEIVYSRN